MRWLSGSRLTACSYFEIASSRFTLLAWSPSLARFTASMLLRLQPESPNVRGSARRSPAASLVARVFIPRVPSARGSVRERRRGSPYNPVEGRRKRKDEVGPSPDGVIGLDVDVDVDVDGYVDVDGDVDVDVPL